MTSKSYLSLSLETSVTANPKKKIVKLAVNEFNGKFTLVPQSTEVIFS